MEKFKKIIEKECSVLMEERKTMNKLLLIILVILFLFGYIYCGTTETIIPPDASNDIQQIQEKEPLPEDINTAFSKYNALCESGNQELLEDKCLSQICLLRVDYNLEVISCKIGRLGYDYEYCSKLKDKYSNKLKEIERNCP